jgi:selenophosphate synthetase-related protein
VSPCFPGLVGEAAATGAGAHLVAIGIPQDVDATTWRKTAKNSTFSEEFHGIPDFLGR